MNLTPSVKAYFGAVRSGLCNAYLAASVVDSGVVSTDQVGVMGKVGSAIYFANVEVCARELNLLQCLAPPHKNCCQLFGSIQKLLQVLAGSDCAPLSHTLSCWLQFSHPKTPAVGTLKSHEGAKIDASRGCLQHEDTPESLSTLFSFEMRFGFCFLQAGAALKLVSGAVPVFGGLAGLVGTALEAGDRHIQTRLVLKVILLV